MNRKMVTVHYRRFYRNRQTPFEEPLSTVVGIALSHENDEGAFLTKVARRVFREQEEGRVLLLNGIFIAKSGAIYGELLGYDPDANIPLLMHGAEDASELDIRQAAKPNDAEFLRGVVFFLLSGDHLVMIDQDIAAPSLEKYVRWLLATATQTTRDDRVQFVPSVLLSETAELKKVKQIRLEPHNHGASLFEDDASSAFDSREGTLRTDVLGILKAAKFESTVLARLVEDQNLAVKLKLTLEFRNGRSPATIEGSDALALLRHVDEDDLVVEGDTARKRRGKLERPKVSEYVERRENGLFDRADAWRALERALQAYKASGYLT